MTDVLTSGTGSALTFQGDDKWVRRRITVIWTLLLFNVMPWIGIPTVFPIPQRVAQLLAAASLSLAVILTVGLNPRLLIRPNVVLFLFVGLLGVALVAGVRGDAGLGAVLRAGRLAAFLAVLWLLTPWWGRRDLLFVRCHLKAIALVLTSVVVGWLLAPSLALPGPDGRLMGVLWPIWPNAVAHFAAMAAGLGVVLWLSRSTSGPRAALLGTSGIALVLLTQTRVALVGLAAGLICATVSLLLTRQRARRSLTVALLVTPLIVVTLAPALFGWFARDQSEEQLRGLSGRKDVWTALVEEPRAEFTQWFGPGLSEKSFLGRSIDNSWLAVYHEQGLIGVAIAGAAVLFLLLAPAFQPAGAARALALFIVVYATVHSYTEVGLGDASAYLLDLVVAASLLPTPGDEESVESTRGVRVLG